MDDTKKEPSESGDSAATEPLLPNEAGNEQIETKKATLAPARSRAQSNADDREAVVTFCWVLIALAVYLWYSRRSLQSTITDLSSQLNKTTIEYESLLALRHSPLPAQAQLVAESIDPSNSVFEDVVATLKERDELRVEISSVKTRLNELGKRMEVYEFERRRKELDEVTVLSRKGVLTGDRHSVTDKLTSWTYGYVSPLPYFGAEVSTEHCWLNTQEQCAIFVPDQKKLVGYRITYMEDTVSLKGSWKAVVVPGILSDGRSFRVSARAPEAGVPLNVTIYTIEA